MKNFLLFFFLVFSIKAYSQGFVFNKLTEKQLPIQSNINSIFQDKHGFIWLASDNGLVKFNGYNSIIYTTSNSNISSNKINAITEDSSGFIWIATDKGLNQFNRNSNQFKTFYSNQRGLPSDIINNLLVDSRGVLWVATNNGLSIFSDGLAINLQHNSANNNSVSSNIITSLAEGIDSSIFIGTINGGLNRFNWKNGVILRYKTTNIKFNDSLKPAPMLAIGDINCLVNHQNNLFIGGNAGLFKLNIKTNASQKIKFDSISVVNSLYPDSNGNIWIGSNKGLYKYNGVKSIFFPEITPNQIANNVLSVLVDKNGTLLVGTRGYCFYGANAGITALYVKTLASDSLSKVNCIFETKGKKILLGTTSGYWYLNINSGSIDKVLQSNPSSKYFINKNIVTSFAEISEDTILVGTAYGLACTALNSEHQNYIFAANQDSIPLYITAIVSDSNQFLVSTLGKGIFKYNRELNKLENFFKKVTNVTSSLASDSVFYLCKENNHNLWVATSHKVQVTTDYKNFKAYEFNEKVTGLCTLSGNIFVTTTNALYVLSKINNLFEEIKLPASSIISMFAGNEKLFIATTNGTIEYDFKNDKTILDQTQIGNIYYQTNDRIKVLCGINKDITILKPNFVITPVYHEIVITSFKIGNQDKQRELYNGDTIRLDHNENSFSIEFAALDYTGKKTIYKHILQGFEDKPTRLSEQQNISYTNIDPGNYQLIISEDLSNNKGSDSEKKDIKTDEFLLNIHIKPPFWKEWWFVSSIILIILALGMLLYYLRLKNIQQKKAEAESRALQSELQALRLQMNPHFIFNSLNSIQSFITENKQDLASEYLALFARLMRMILDNSSKHTIPISKELETLEIYLTLERVRFDNQFDYKFVIDPSVDIHWHTIPPMLIQPYIENSIKHGLRPKTSGGLIKIIMVMKDETNLLCSIEDNGIGRKKAMELKSQRLTSHKSVAMEATKDRLDILNSLRKQKVSVKIIDLYQKDIATGTRVELIIPSEEEADE